MVEEMGAVAEEGYGVADGAVPWDVVWTPDENGAVPRDDDRTLDVGAVPLED